MSIFKKKESANADIDKALGQKRPEPKAHLTRQENKANLKKQFDIETQKGLIIEELKKAYNQINLTSYYEQSDRVMQIMSNLKTGAVDQNARAVYALDGLIYRYVQQLTLYCKQNNLYGIMNAIDNIDYLVNQRAYVTAKQYENAEYIRAKVQLMELQVNRENLTSEINKKIDSFNNLKASAAGESEAKRMQIQKQMLQIKNEKDKLQSQSDAIEVQIKNVTTLVGQIEQNSSIYLPNEIVDQFGNVLEETKQRDAEMAQVTKMAEKIDASNKTALNQGMTVSDADSVNESNVAADLESMEI